MANIQVPSKEERKTEGGEHPSSEFRAKKKERQTERQRVANIRVPSSEKKERKTEGGEHPSSEFRVKKKERPTERQRVANIRVPSSE